jgi:hypothetical protein
MSENEKLLFRIPRGTSDANISFTGLCGLLRSLSFRERVRGSRHIFTKEDLMEILNLQPKSAGKAKPYQVGQICRIILKYRLRIEENDG